FQLGDVVVGRDGIKASADQVQKLAARIDLRLETSPGHERIADEIDAADVNHRAFGNVEDHPRVPGFIPLDQLDAGEQTAQFLVPGLDRVHGHAVGDRVQGRAFPQAGEGLEFIGFEVFGAVIDDFLDGGGKLRDVEVELDLVLPAGLLDDLDVGKQFGLG